MMKRIIILILLIFLVITGSLSITIKKENGWICQHTGSNKSDVTWFHVWKTQSVFHKSPLQLWMERNNIAFEHKWIRTCGTSHGLFVLSRGHSSAPAISRFYLLNEYLKTASSNDIIDLIEILKTDDRQKQIEFVRKLESEIEERM